MPRLGHHLGEEPAASPSRRSDLDNLRTFLTAVIILHHTAIPYGGAGSWPLKSKAFEDDAPILVSINAFDQSFALGLFFWISGRVSAQSLHRKLSRWEFVKGKLLRLGLPAVFYTFVVDPLVRLMALSTWDANSITSSLVDTFSTLRGVRGPVWYTATLLLFDSVAALTSRWVKDNSLSKRVSYASICRWGWILVAVCSFLVRTLRHTAFKVPLIAARSGYLSQYIFAYALGHLAYWQGEPRFRGLFDRKKSSNYEALPSEIDEDEAAEQVEGVREPSGRKRFNSRIILAGAVALSFVSMGIIFIPRLADDSENWREKTLQQYAGGWTLPSLLYAIWNEFSFAIVGPALMFHFQQEYAHRSASVLFDARASYTAFLIHPPVSVSIEVLLDILLCPGAERYGWMSGRVWEILGPVVVTVVVSVLNITATFVVAGRLLHWIPSLRKIL